MISDVENILFFPVKRLDIFLCQLRTPLDCCRRHDRGWRKEKDLERVESCHMMLSTVNLLACNEVSENVYSILSFIELIQKARIRRYCC
jgi:hypothetical protein